MIHQLIRTVNDIAYRCTQIVTDGIHIYFRIGKIQIFKEHPVEIVIIILSCMSQNTIEVLPALIDNRGKADNFLSHSGKGVSGEVNGKTYYIGSAKFVSAHAADAEDHAALLEEYAAQGKTPVALACENKIAALFAVADTVKEGSAAAIARLKAMKKRVVMITGDNRVTAEAVAHIERCIADTSDMVVRMDDNVCAVVRFSDDGQTPYDFAQFLYQSLYEEVGVKASMGVGGEVGTFAEISSSYHQAVTAVRMSAVFHGKGEVHSYKEYLLVKMLEEVPESRLKEYLEQLQIGDAREIFDDEEMVNTAEEFLQSSLNVSETSRNLFMHRNTLMYRLDKIERVTGLNIRKFSDAVSFRVITILYKLMQMN